MRSRKLLVGTLAILASTIAAWAAWTCYSSWYEIPVVRTYGDLLRVRPLEVEGGVTVRVGLEARACTVGNGVLVYVLLEGAYKPTNSTLSGDQTGPLLIRARRGIVADEPPLRGMSPPVWPDPPAGTKWTLLTTRFGIPEEGEWRVEALTLAGEAVRNSRLEARAGAVHPWIRWGEWVGGTGFPGAPEVVHFHLGPEVFLGELKPSMKLPVLFPESPDPTLEISAIEDGVSVQSTEEIVTVAGEYPLLVRLWRNGTPWVPNAASYGSLTMLVGTHPGTSLDLRVEPAVGSDERPGDRFEIQVFHCPYGWGVETPSPWKWVWSSLPQLDHYPFTRLSNRVALTTQ